MDANRIMFRRIFFAVCLATTLARGSVCAADWEQTVPAFAPGSFSEPRPVKLEYAFGWSGLTAAVATARFYRSNDQFVLDGKAETIGVARGLWPFDVQHISSVDAHTLRPIEVKEVERRRSKRFDTHLGFTAERVMAHRIDEKKGKAKTNDKSFDFPNVMSLNSALLYLRSKPLANGTVERVVVYPGRAPYLCTLSVLGRERITVPAGGYDTIKLDVKLDKVGDDRELKPHKKFKSATVWLSNDPDRLIVKIEAQIFIGSVFAELRSAQFETPKS